LAGAKVTTWENVSLNPWTEASLGIIPCQL